MMTSNGFSDVFRYKNVIFISKHLVEQQYLYFPLPWFGWTGLNSGTREPVLGHKDCGNVSLVVNDYFIG